MSAEPATMGAVASLSEPASAERRRAAGSRWGGRSVRRRFNWFDVNGVIPLWLELTLGVVAWVGFVGLWWAVVALGWANPRLVPGPGAVLTAWVELFTQRQFLGDVLVSVRRITLSFALAVAFALPLGVLMGALRPVEALLNPLVAPARYLPAPSFAPLLLMWFGTGDEQKLALLFLGVVWFLVTLIMDHTKRMDPALLATARTLGCRRGRLITRVVLPEAMPGLVDAMRQMLAVSWTYLVIAEIIAATDGIGAMMMRAKRFVRTDEIMAGILTIGLLGIAFDLLFRLLHRWWFPHCHRPGPR